MGEQLASYPQKMTGTLRALALPDHTDTDTQINFIIQSQRERQEDIGKENFFMPVHHSILTIILFGLSLCVVFTEYEEDTLQLSSQVLLRYLIELNVNEIRSLKVHLIFC